MGSPRQERITVRPLVQGWNPRHPLAGIVKGIEMFDEMDETVDRFMAALPIQDRMKNLTDVRRIARQTGNKFFSKSAMRFFNSRIVGGTRSTSDGQVWFITSEKMDDDLHGNSFPRLYKVRRAMMQGDRLDITSVGEEHATVKDAQRAMLAAIKG